MEAFDRELLKTSIEPIIIRVFNAQYENLDLYRNTLDCFSALIDALVQGISLDDWLEQEKARQVQKTKQNAIGDLHMAIMGSIKGVEWLPNGNLIDIKCDRLKIVAEVKNKHNTTKGNNKIVIYNDLSHALNSAKFKGYTGFCVEILPKSRQKYNTTFVPSDNRTKKKVIERADIRKIDGCSFYELLTGKRNALNELYLHLPEITAEILTKYCQSNGKVPAKFHSSLIITSKYFQEFFEQAYGE